MTIERITYSRTKNINHSDAECIEISIDIDSKDESEKEAAFEYLRAWVEDKMQVREQTAKLYDRKNELQRQVYSLEEDVAKAKAKWQKVTDFLEKTGVSSVDDIPF